MEFKRLTDLLEFIVDNRGKTVPTSETGIKLIATNCILNNRLFPVYEKVRYVSKKTYDTWFRSHPKNGDIIFVNKGTPGKVCMVPEPVDFCIAQDMMAFRADSSKIYNKYLFAVLRSSMIQNQIANSTVGTLIPHYKKEQLRDLMIPVPNTILQKKIGDIYYNLSYKIELNNQINNILHELIINNYSKYLEELDDYEELDIKDIFDFEKGVEPGSKNYLTNKEEGAIKFFRVRDMNSNCGTYIKKELVNGKILNEDDVVVSFDATIGRIGFGLNGSFSTGIKKISIKDKYKCITDNSLVYAYFSNKKVQNIMMENARGTTILHASSSIESMKFKYNQILLKKYTKIISLLFKKMKNLKKENEHLSDIRNTLLPKLISGEINLDNIEI